MYDGSGGDEDVQEKRPYRFRRTKSKVFIQSFERSSKQGKFKAVSIKRSQHKQSIAMDSKQILHDGSKSKALFYHREVIILPILINFPSMSVNNRPLPGVNLLYAL